MIEKIKALVNIHLLEQDLQKENISINNNMEMSHIMSHDKKHNALVEAHAEETA